MCISLRMNYYCLLSVTSIVIIYYEYNLLIFKLLYLELMCFLKLSLNIPKRFFLKNNAIFIKNSDLQVIANKT